MNACPLPLTSEDDGVFGMKTYGVRQFFTLSILASISLCALAPSRSSAATKVCCAVAGDADHSGAINIGDAVTVIEYIFVGGAAPQCLEEGDADGSGSVNIGDVVKLIEYILFGGGAPSCPASGDSTLTSGERLAAFNAIDSVASALEGVSQDSLANALLTFLSGRSEFEEVGKDGTSIWARFIDGRMVSIPNNRLVVAPTPARVDNREVEPAPSGGTLVTIPPRKFDSWDEMYEYNRARTNDVSTSALTYELPEWVEAIHIEALHGPCFNSFAYSATTRLGTNGYIPTQVYADVSQLLTEVQNCGVFYIDTHCGFCETRAGQTVGALDTRDDWSASHDSTYATMLDDGELVYMYAADGNGLSNPRCADYWRYAFTGLFVANYMTFSKNSLVYISACQSDASPSLKAGFMAAGASTYVGWTHPVTDDGSNKAGDFLFDRLIGGNASVLTPIESPKQRPFTIDFIWQDMKDRGLDIDPHTGSQMMVTKLQGEFGLLAPSLRFVEVINTTDTLFLTGFFGKDPGANGHVFVGGVEMTVFTWEPLYIWADIPRSGPGSSGPVYVVVDGQANPTPLVGRKSNIVNLTAWDPDFIYTLKDQGTLTGTVTVNAHFRADVHSFREFPHLPAPAPNAFLVFSGIKNSGGSATATGQFIYPVPNSDPHEDITYDWAGGTTLGWLNEPNPNQGVLIQGAIHANQKQMDLLMFGTAVENMKETAVSSLSGFLYESDLFFPIISEVYHAPLFTPFTLDIKFDNNWVILPGELDAVTCCGHGDEGVDINHKLKWTYVPGAFPPDPNAAQ